MTYRHFGTSETQMAAATVATLATVRPSVATVASVASVAGPISGSAPQSVASVATVAGGIPGSPIGTVATVANVAGGIPETTKPAVAPLPYADWTDEARRDLYEERAAIMEYDGGLMREAAEAAAWHAVFGAPSHAPGTVTLSA